MTLFDVPDTQPPPPPPRASRATVVGVSALAVALVVLLILTFLPTAYVIQRPGPVYDTLGSVQTSDGDEVPLISIEGAATYETAGSLDLTTVQVVGNRERPPSWWELAFAWFDPSRAVVPIETVFPEGVTTEERSEQNASLMVDSQQEATAAALTNLGYEVEASLEVVEPVEGTPSDGVLEAGDVIVEADGVRVTDVDQLREVIQDAEGAAVSLVVERDGDEYEESIVPEELVGEDGESSWVIGVILVHDYTFPIDVTIQLDNVGGPSAGQMFALGIIDTLTPGELNGGAEVAGTGTISADGTIGTIGGIRQKLYGARDDGAAYFLAPTGNCDEVVGHVPSGLRVFAVETLDDSVAVLDAIAADGDLDALAACEAS